MNVGLVVPGFSADDADWCIPALRHLAGSLASAECLRVVTIRYPYRASRYRVDGVDVIAVGGAERRGPSTLGLWQTTLRTLAAQHRRQPFDVLHAFWATESGLLAALAGRLLRIPTLVSLAGGELVGLRDIGYGDQLRPWERLKVRAALRLATAVSAGSKYLAELAQPYAQGKCVQLLPLGVDTALFPAERERSGSGVLHVGALTPVKDQQMLLHGFASLRRSHPSATLDVIGDGPLGPHLQALATRLGIAGAVRFAGAQNHAELAAQYQAADALVVSSRHEAQCMVALEAAACGTPVVGTHVGVLPELGPTVAVGDPHGLAATLEAMLEQPCDARQVVQTTYSLQVTVDGFRQCYARLAG